MASPKKFRSFYRIGYESPVHRNRRLRTVFNNARFEDYLENLKNSDFEVGYIPIGYEHRPDLISDLFYDTPEYDWLILLFNNIHDPFESLNVGDRILIPRLR